MLRQTATMYFKVSCAIFLVCLALQQTQGNRKTIKAYCELKRNGVDDTGPHGRIDFEQKDGSNVVEFHGVIKGLTPGKHGMHIHEKGDVISKGCTSAGAHFNPHHKNHGGPTDAVRHVGDLGNIDADVHGKAQFRRKDEVISLRPGTNNIMGRACMVHQNVDDLGRGGGDSKNTGNAGARVVCGKIFPSK